LKSITIDEIDLPDILSKEELMEKKKREIIKKYGKPIRKFNNKEKLIKEYGSK